MPVYSNEPAKKFFVEVGASFGGDEVATNDNVGLGGDNYNTGAVLGLGTKLAVSEKIKVQGLAAYRYQAGDGSNSGFVFEGVALLQLNPQISLGLGVHADFNSETETATGEVIEFEDAVGPMFLADWAFDSRRSVGAKYISMDYESVDGVEYAGGQVALYVQIKF